MKIEMCDTKFRGTLCAVIVTKQEALMLIQSLSNQLVANYSNVGRLESKCTGDANEMTIFVGDT
jgi:hypothetical protein